MSLDLLLRLDTELDRTYDGYTETGVLTASTRRGRQNRLGIADIGEAEITVESADGRWYLDRSNAIAGLARGIGARLSCVANGTTVAVITGRIKDIKPILMYPGGKAHAAIVTLYELSQDLDVEISTNLRENQRIEGLIGHAVSQAGWMHGSSLDNGDANIVGYAWATRQSAREWIDELANADGGLVFTTRLGRLDFHDREFRPAFRITVDQDVTPILTGYEEQEHDVYTAVTVRAHRHRLRGVQPVWTFNGNMKLNVGATRKMLVDLTEPVKSLVDPIYLTNGKQDWKVFKQKVDGTPDEEQTRNGSLNVTARRVGAQKARLKITNTHATDKLSITELRLRGRPIKERSGRPVRRENNTTVIVGSGAFNDAAESGGEFPLDSIAGVYYRRRHEVDLNWVQSTAQAERLAKHLIKRLGTPQPDIIVECKAKTEADVAALCARELSDRIRITIATLGLTNRDYWLDAIEHTFNAEEGKLTSRLRLTPTHFVSVGRRDRALPIHPMPDGVA